MKYLKLFENWGKDRILIEEYLGEELIFTPSNRTISLSDFKIKDIPSNYLNLFGKYLNNLGLNVTPEDFIQDRISYLKKNIHLGYEFVEIFRSIIPIKNEINKNLGVYWTPDIEFAIPYNTDEFSSNEPIILNALCNLKDVDWKFSLDIDNTSTDIPKPIEEWGTTIGEVEIRLKKGSVVYLKGYYKDKDFVEVGDYFEV